MRSAVGVGVRSFGFGRVGIGDGGDALDMVVATSVGMVAVGMVGARTGWGKNVTGSEKLSLTHCSATAETMCQSTSDKMLQLQ